MKTKKYLQHALPYWLESAMSNRYTCTNPRCENGKINIQTERSSWEYPGAWEEVDCEICNGLGYFPAKKRKARRRCTLKSWMTDKIIKDSIDFAPHSLLGYMMGVLNVMACSSTSPEEAKKMAVNASYAAQIYNNMIKRHRDWLFEIENERIAKMYQEVGL